MAYQFPLNGGRINASIGGNSTSAGAGYSLVSTGTLLLAGGNNITLSQNGSAITISGANSPSGSINFSASNTSANLASVTFSNSNGVSFGLNAGVITASHNGLTTQSNQALSASNGSFAFQTAGFSNANGVTFGTSAGSIMTASVNTSYAASNHSHGNPTLNLTNLSGTTASASNGVTLSLSAAAQSAQTQSNIQGIIASNSTNRTGDISFANSNGVTFGLSNNTITASVMGSAPAFSAGLSTDGYGNTGMVTNRVVLMANTNMALIQVTDTQGASIILSANAFSGGISNIGNTSGTSGTASNQVVFAGGNNITLSQSTGAGGNTITISGGAGGGAAFSAGTQSANTGTVNFANSNGITFGMSGSSQITASHNGLTTQTNQTVGLYALGNTTQNSSTTLDARTLSFNGLGGATMGYSNGSVQVSAPAQSSLSATGIFSISANGSTISMGAPAYSVGISTNGNTSGTTGFATNQMLLVGGNNVTLSQSTGAGGNTITVSAASQSSPNISFYALGNTTQNSSTQLNASNISFNGLGGVSVGYSNGSIQISGNAGGGGGLALANSQTTYTSGTANLNVVGGALTIASTTGQSFNFSVPNISSWSATGAISLSTNGNTVSIGAPAMVQVGMSTGGNTSGTSGMNTNALVLAGGNNITLSQSTNAGGATITISGGAGGGGGGIAIANSQTTYTSGTAQFVEAGGALTIASTTGQRFNFSVPAQSNLSATGAVSISNNGNTISIGAPVVSSIIGINGISLSTTSNSIYISPADTSDFYQNMDRGTTAVLGTANGTLVLQPLGPQNGKFPFNMTANTVLFNMSANITATASSSAHTYSASIGVYSDNATALSLINSASTSWALTADTNNTAAYHGVRWISFASSQWSSSPALQQGANYVFGVVMRSSGLAMPLSYIGQNYMNSVQRSGTIGTSVATATTLAQGNYWNGMYGTSTTALPTVISSNQVNRNNATAIFMPHIVLNNRYSGTF